MTPDTPELDPLLTGREVATRLNITTRTLDRWVTDGTIVPLRLPNGYRRYRTSDVDALLTIPRYGNSA